MATDYTIKADPREPLLIELVGEKYTIKPPKVALSLKLGVTAKQMEQSGDVAAMNEALHEWVKKAFGDKAQSVWDRMDDEDDDLDIPHIMKLMQAVSEHVTGNPTS